MRSRTRGDVGRRIAAMAGIALVHVSVYFVVTRLTLLRPAAAFIDPHLPLDDRIPHLAWTWPLYWLPYLLVPVAVGISITRLELPSVWRLFRRGPRCSLWAASSR